MSPKDDWIRGRSLSCHRRVHLQSVISFIRGSIVVILLGSHCIPEQQITLCIPNLNGYTHEVDSPNLSTVVLAICGRSASDLRLLGISGHPPNMVTSVNPGPRLKAAALCSYLDWRLGALTCTINQHSRHPSLHPLTLKQHAAMHIMTPVHLIKWYCTANNTI